MYTFRKWSLIFHETLYSRTAGSLASLAAASNPPCMYTLHKRSLIFHETLYSREDFWLYSR